jgi:hypothetical protein
VRTLVILAWIAGVPVSVLAQAAIAGAVTDQSGAPLPGVSVVASSAALIEKDRTAVTDGAGHYRIEDLRPGLYVVRFTLSGMSPREQGNVELSGTFTATVNAELMVGPVTEALTVTAQSPVVDVHNAGHEATVSGDLIRTLPTVRSYNALLTLVPGVLTNVNDIVTGTATTSFPIHGGRVNEGRLFVDGLNVGSPPSANSATNYVVDTGNAQEVTFTPAGVSGEVETGGLVMNVVPRTGGGRTTASFFASGTGGALQSDNLTQALRAQGVLSATPLTRVYDVSGTVGGAIVKDRVWYFVNAHTGGSTKENATVYYNLNAGDPGKWLYVPDLRRREYSDRTFDNASGRVTWQMTPRNKITGFWDQQSLCGRCSGATPGLSEPQQISPEAVGVLGRPLHVSQVRWSSPATTRLLFEASYGGTSFGVGNFERVPNPTRDLIRVAEQCASGCPANGNIPGLVYGSQDFSVAYTGSYLWKGSVSYVTGTHSLKVGYQHTLMTDDRTWYTNDQNLTYRVNNGVPNQLTESISPWVNDARAGWDALYAQEQWTRNRLTLQGAVRFDRAQSWFPAQQEGPSKFLATPIVIPETRGVDSYLDVTPRVGAAYDVSGTGRTALKITLGKYLESAGVSGNYANANPTLRLPQTTSAFGTAGVTRTWTDANRNFVPDCDLSNPNMQDLRATGGDLCGVVSNTSFGQNILSNNFASDVLKGWGVRPSDWDLGVSLHQQIGSRSSFEIAYIRRWYQGFFVADNLAVQPADLTPYSITAPLDSRLPGGGGYTISGLYDVVPAKAGQVNNLIANAANYGAWSQYYNGLDVTADARLAGSLVLIAGVGAGQTVADNCEVRGHLPDLTTTATGTSAFGPGLYTSAVTPVNPYCHVAFGALPQFRGLSSYLIPRVDVEVAATFQSKPGAMLAANYAVPNAAVVPSLGRNLSGNAPNVTVNLVAPGTLYGDRINQLDLRVGKVIKYGRSRTRLSLDVYNALNSSAVLTYNMAFVPGGTWQQPMSILTPRFLRFGAEIDF